MIIDGHAHACGAYGSIQSIKQYLYEHNIDMVVLTGGEPDSDKNFDYPMLSNLFKGEQLGYFFNNIIRNVTKLKKMASHIDEQNKFVCTISKNLPEKVINTYWVNPLDNNYLEKMTNFYQEHGFRMIKLHQCWTDFDISSETCIEIFKWGAENKLPAFIHLVSQKQVMKFVDVANRFPDTVFIVAHMIGSNCMINRLNNNNVFFDLSAPQLYSIDILKQAIDAYGAGKLILGSDTPYGNNNIEKITLRLKQLHLSEHDIKLICGENIKRLLML